MNPSRFLSMIEDAPARAHAWNDMSEYARREAVQHSPEFLKYVHLSWERLPMNIKSGLSHLGESKSANARLIAAAPELLAALEKLAPYALQRAETEPPFTAKYARADYEIARAAIAKATGGAK